MKNNNIRTIFFSLIVLVSISSYVFLNTVAVPSPSVDTSLTIEEVEIEKMANQETIMPDVKIVKSAVEFLKKMLPISQ